MATANATAPLAAAGPVGGEPVSRRVLHELASRVSPVFVGLEKGMDSLSKILKMNKEEFITGCAWKEENKVDLLKRRLASSFRPIRKEGRVITPVHHV